MDRVEHAGMSSDQTNPNPNESNPHGTPEKKTIRPPGVLASRDPSSGPVAADQLTVLAHDLSNMLDGSMRWLGLAAAALPEDDRTRDLTNLTNAREQINTVLSDARSDEHDGQRGDAFKVCPDRLADARGVERGDDRDGD